MIFTLVTIHVSELGTLQMKSKEPSEQLLQFSNRLKSKLPTGSGRAFAAKASIGYSTLHNYLSAVSSPTLENLVLLADALGVSIEWLATGKGSSATEMSAIDAKDFSQTISIPFIEQEDYLLLDRYLLQDRGNINHLVALRVTNDVMEPTFGIGSVLIIDQSQKYLKESKIVVMRKGRSYLYKRVQIISDGYSLNSDNEKYNEIVIREESLSTFEVLGEVILVMNQL